MAPLWLRNPRNCSCRLRIPATREIAQGRDLRKLVPVSLDGTLPPIGFRQYQSIALSGWKGDATAPGFAALLRGIAAAGRTQHGPQAAPRADPGRNPPDEREFRKEQLLPRHGSPGGTDRSSPVWLVEDGLMIDQRLVPPAVSPAGDLQPARGGSSSPCGSVEQRPCRGPASEQEPPKTWLR